MVEESELEQPLEAAVELGAVEAEGQGHGVAAIEGGAVSVRGQGQEDHRGDGLRTEA